MDRNYDDEVFQNLQYALRADHDTRRQSSYDTLGQSAYDTLGQPVYESRGQSSYDTQGQSAYDTLGQPVYESRGQSSYDTLGQASYETVGQSSYDTLGFATPVQQSWSGTVWPDDKPRNWDLDEELAQMLSTAPVPDPAQVPLASPDHGSGRRRPRADAHLLDGGGRVTHVTLLVAAILVCAACMLGWSIAYSYGQLHGIAESVLPPELARWWPLMVYGPWFVAALSIVRATVQRRRTWRSWSVMLTASAMAVALSVSHAAHTPLAYVMVGLPPITALVCFWELVGQVSSRSRPRHAAPAQRGVVV